MFAADDMATFCRILSRKYPFPGSLLIAITGVAQTTRVLKLLEPFRRIHGMASVKITGLIEDDYRSDLITKMLKQAPDSGTVLQEIKNVTKEGDQIASNHDYSTAVSRFRKAFDDTDDYWKTYDTAEVIVESGEFNGQSLTVAFAQLLVTLTMKLAMTNLKLGNFRQMSGWIKLGSRYVMKRILRSEVVKTSRASEKLAIEKLGKAMRKHADYLDAYVESITDLVHLNDFLCDAWVKHGAKELSVVLRDHKLLSIIHAGIGTLAES